MGVLTARIVVIAIVLSIVVTPKAFAANSTDRLIRKAIQENYVTALLLTDGESMRLGFHNFDPNTVLPVQNEELGSEEAVSQRNKLALFSLPYRWKFDEPILDHSVSIGIRASYLEEKEEVSLVGSDTLERDEIVTQVAVVTLDSIWRYHLSNHWKLDRSLAWHYLEMRNDTSFNSDESRSFSPLLDGLITNFKTQAWVAAPGLGIHYFAYRKQSRFEYFSNITYLFGDSFNTKQTAHEAKPEAWFWSNGVEKKFPIYKSFPQQTAIIRAARMDVGGDLVNPVGSAAYYELGVGWYTEVSDALEFIDNVGLVLNFNYGSNFRGGTLAFLINVD